MALSEGKARAALEREARGLGVDAETATRAVLEVVNSNMERAIRVITVERGYDPREFTLVSYGGAGGLHACDLAAALGIGRGDDSAQPGGCCRLGGRCVAT